MRRNGLKWLPLVASGILVSTWISVAVQTPRVDNNALKNAAKGTEWLTYGHDYMEQRYSPLTRINASNVAGLKLAWSIDVGPGGGPQEGTPLFANGVLYGVTNWSITFAVDARTGRELWRHDPQADRNTRLCCGVITRGVALYEGKIILPVVDGRLQALDAATGKLLWSVWATPEKKEGELSPYSITMAPRVANGKVFIGNAGAEFTPFRGYVSAFDVNDGKELWRFYIVPGDPSKPFENKAMAEAAKTWTGEWWKLGGGGSMWDGMAYDVDTNLLFVGTGNGLPWPQDIRHGEKSSPRLDNLYVASIIAIDATTGELKWHYQCTPGDQWDYDAIQHLMLADLRINGRDRKVIMQVNKNGYFYVIDRTNGEFISGEPVSRVSWTKGLDAKGRPMINEEAYYTSEQGVTVQPLQAHNTSQMAFNPTTGLVYVPISPSSTYNFTAVENFTPATTRQGQDFGIRTGRGGSAPPLATPPSIGPVRDTRGGILSAWDPVTQKERWFRPGGGQSGGGALSTAANLVIQSTPQGQLMVYTADNGDKLLELPIGQTGGIGPPMTYELDGKQYIALMAGQGGGGRGRGAAAPAEPTAAAAQRGNVPAPPPQINNPKLYVFTVDPASPAR